MTTNYATEAQINYIAGLLSSKAWNQVVGQQKYLNRAAAINLAISWAIDPSQLGAGRASIEAVATSDLLGQRVNQILAHAGTGADAENAYAWAPLTRKGATAMIDWLKPIARKAEAATGEAAPAKQERVELEDGMYMVDKTIYKVQHSLSSGRQYAKVAHIESIPGSEGAGSDVWSVTFAYAPGAIAKIRPEHKMSYEQAKEFGALYGTCCCCGRTLSNELSIALGIGPVCGEREFGGEFKLIIKAAKLELKAS